MEIEYGVSNKNCSFLGIKDFLSGSKTRICGPVIGILKDIFLPENHTTRIEFKEVDWLTLIVKH